jgi:hypothetical protein
MKLIVIIFSLILLASCSCDCDVQIYGKHRFKKSDVAYNKITDIKILILDTLRVDCELYYKVVDADYDYYYISEVELK